MEDIDDDQLDSLLDSLLIRIVEMLVEMSSSDIELQEELNAPDKSGFTLIHYASLYNLQSLLPVLLSRGANSDALSVRGKLTPLHLACGAGHFAVVELLTRNGCAIEVKDSSSLTPADHGEYSMRTSNLKCYNFANTVKCKPFGMVFPILQNGLQKSQEKIFYCQTMSINNEHPILKEKCYFNRLFRILA